jgi:hypothetical protein
MDGVACSVLGAPMIRIAVAERTPREVREWCESADVSIEQYHGPESVPLPDLGDALTRGVLEGRSHSLMPIQVFPYQVLAAITVSSLHMLDDFCWDARWNRQFDHPQFRMPGRSVLIIEYGCALVFTMSPGVYGRERLCIADLLGTLDQSISDVVIHPCRRGGILPAFPGSLHIHIGLSEGAVYFLGLGRHYTEMRKR